MKDTLPERLSLARTRQLSHTNFLELLLSDEVSRRDARSATVRAAHAGLAPLMRLDTWNDHGSLRIPAPAAGPATGRREGTVVRLS